MLRKQNVWSKNCIYEALKNITWFFDHKTAMELCNKVSQPSVVKNN